MLLLRYEKRGEVYVPQYDTGGGWNEFTYNRVSNCLLGTIAEVLFNSCYPGRKFEDEVKQKGYVFFNRNIHVCAFLGAAKSWYTNIAYEFDIDIKQESND